MAVSNYLAKSEYGCRYHYDKLEKTIYLVSKYHVKDIIIDNGEAYISGLSENPIRLDGLNVEFKEETSLDERYRFQKSLTLTLNDYETLDVLDEKYYAIIVAKDGTFFMINVDFPSDATYTYNFSNNAVQTTFSLVSVSNYPTLKLNGFNPDVYYTCNAYKNNRLKNIIYLVSEDHVKDIVINDGEVCISGLSENPIRVDGLNIDFKEEASLDERYKFQKTLDFTVNGVPEIVFYRWVNIDPNIDYICSNYNKYYKQIQEKYEVNIYKKYYIIVVSEENVYYMINVDFPSKLTYTYNLSNNANQTVFTFSSVSNFPTLKLIDFNPEDVDSCKFYNINGAEGLRMLEAAKTEFGIDETEYGNTLEIISTEPFKTVEYLDNSFTLQETYDGENFQTKLDFNITLDAYKSSWQYNLLEFVLNKYAAIIGLKNSTDKIHIGFKEGLEPNYTITANTTQGQSDIITISLVEMSNRGLTIGTFNESLYTDYHWRYINKIGNKNSYICLGGGVAAYLLQEESDYFGNPTGNYKVRSGYANWFPELNIIGEFSDVVTFYNPYCLSYKWLACYSDSHVEMANCDESHLIYVGEINVQNLVTVYVGECVNTLRSGALKEATSLISVYIPDSVTSIEQTTFWGCTSLPEIAIPNSVKEISSSVFTQCYSLEHVTFSNDVTSIGTYAFDKCYNLKSINSGVDGYFNIPNTVTAINQGTFYECRSLKNINIHNNITYIGKSAFWGCIGLEDFTISESVTSIDDYAFDNCSGLTSVTIHAVTPPSLGVDSFRNTNNCPIYVPSGSVNAYKSAWSEYADRIAPI